jgi:TRAP transporter TAXI family solute receptor
MYWEEGMKRVLLLASVVVAGAIALAQQKPTVVIPTGSTGGVFFFYGTAAADILAKAGIANASAVQTGGSYDNIILLRDRTDPGSNTYYCGLATTDSAFVTYTGQEPRFKDKKADMQRVMFYMYPSLIHIVTTKSKGIKVMQDLKGKRISTGQPGSSTENLALLVLQGAGVSVDSFAKRERLPAAESAKALGEGTIDAYFWVGGVPTASIVELGQTLSRKNDKIAFINLDANSTTAQLVFKRFPGLTNAATVPARVYGTEGNVRGLETGNVMICPSSMPEDLAYNLTKTIFENIKTLQTAVAPAKDTTPANAAKLYGVLNNTIPFHPGAVKYFKEIGALK